MAISTNSIIHYTRSIEILKSILKEGFRIKYCSEELSLGETDGSKAAHPMISFCDILLSSSTDHLKKYGKYGIGLSKKWAVKIGTNPVLYIDQNSLFANSLSNLLKDRRSKKNGLTAKQRQDILKIKAYAKNYSGHLKKNEVDDPNYRFYDEREWRFIPERSQMDKAPFSVSLNKYLEDKDKYNKKLEHLRFEFSPDDISYIIVQKTSEIPEMINFLRENYSDKCTARELDILFSKICSTEQIIDDY